jgi:AcrR family transcriptional regulator
MSALLSSRPAATLAERHADLTERAILDAAVQLLEESSVRELTMRAVAAQAKISERTVFRYFATREEFLGAIAEEVGVRMRLPAPPATLAELTAFPAELYAAFEAKAKLTRASLHSELVKLIRPKAVGERLAAVRAILAKHAPGRSARDIRVAAANIQYYLTATAWQFLRFYLGLSLEEAVACAQSVIRLTSADLKARRAR